MCAASICSTARRFSTSSHISPAFLRRSCGVVGSPKRKPARRKDALSQIRSNLGPEAIFYSDVKNSKISTLPPRNSDGVTVIIETPKGHRNKFKYDEQQNVFKLSGVLPVGSSFPYDFGFIPSTKAPDGDPIDVLLLMDEPA